MKLITGSSLPKLEKDLVAHGAEKIDVSLKTFANGERRVKVNPSQVAGQTIHLLQSMSEPVDSHFVETLLLADALERAGAKEVKAIIPWLGYSLQDKVFTPGEPIGAKVIATALSNSFITHVTLLDLHNSSIPGFFSIPTIHLSADELFASYIQTNFPINVVITSPDFGGLKRAHQLADQLKLPLANIDKHRDLQTGKVTAVSIQGSNVEGKDVMLFDDCIMSGSTVVETAKLLKEQGALSVHFLATHGIFTGDAMEKLENSAVDTIVVTNSVNRKNELKTKKITYLDISSLLIKNLN